MGRTFPKSAFLIFAFLLCGSLSANAQYFAEKSKQLDSLWTVVRDVENAYRSKAATYKTKASCKGRRVTTKGYDANKSKVFREKIRYSSSGVRRRRFMAYYTTTVSTTESTAVIVTQGFVLKTYGDNIAFANGTDGVTRKRIKIVDNRVY